MHQSHPIRLLTLVWLLIWANAAHAEDILGIYWDTAYTETHLVEDTFPAVHTGYLVLRNPAGIPGVLGWECCVEIEGSALFLGWDLEGQNLNLNSPPCFIVGISEPPLPGGVSVLLATFTTYVTDSQPVTFNLTAPWGGSLPGQMVYLASDDPGTLRPMTTASGEPSVAWINAGGPRLEIDSNHLRFPDTIAGYESTMTLTVTNLGFEDATLAVALNDTTGFFSLNVPNGPLAISARSEVLLELTFNPQEGGFFNCWLSLGELLPQIFAEGRGLAGNLSWDMPDTLDFGTISTGQRVSRWFDVSNTGDLRFTINPTPSSCPQFVVSNFIQFPVGISPGNSLRILIDFQPDAVGAFICNLDLGDVLPDVVLTGRGRDPQYDWNVPATVEFAAVGVGHFQQLYCLISNTGEAAFTIAPDLPDSCASFIIAPEHLLPKSLFPGQDFNLPIRFQPDAVGEFACTLGLGELLPDVALTGQGREPQYDWNVPATVGFSTVKTGQFEELNCLISNTGDLVFTIAPDLPDSCASFIIAPEHLLPKSLFPGQDFNLPIRFQPDAVGEFACTLGLGELLPDVALTGTGVEEFPTWSCPTNINFGTIPLGGESVRDCVITNTGNESFMIEPNLAEDCGPFTIIAGGQTAVLGPGDRHTILIKFTPAPEESGPCYLLLGNIIPPVRLRGVMSLISLEAPDALEFGDVPLGEQKLMEFTVRNTGNTRINCNFQFAGACSPFEVLEPRYASNYLEPGDFIVFVVALTPTSIGPVSCTLGLASNFLEVQCRGSGSGDFQAGENQVGIFFDSDYSRFETVTNTTPEVISGFLVLSNPSNISGVGGWECAFDLVGNGQFLTWQLAGQAINAGTYNNLVVGIGGEPLPHAPNILLATCQILVPHPTAEIALLLEPTQNPSISGQMAWGPWDSPGVLLPMQPITQTPTVAWINNQTVAVEQAPPAATLIGRNIQLEWPAPHGPVDGCHLYRRDDSGNRSRLTEAPLRIFGDRIEFRDQPAGYEAGTVFHYSYTVVREGIESDPSPETRVVFEFALPAMTRLLPNIPNPFNPNTRIAFELSHPSRVTIGIYDLTGRLILNLVQDHMEAGPHTRTWQGVDRAGRRVPSGPYFVRLFTAGRTDTRKILLLK